jgi:hypothetical protein
MIKVYPRVLPMTILYENGKGVQKNNISKII